jgi:hypothetical protein
MKTEQINLLVLLGIIVGCISVLIETNDSSAYCNTRLQDFAADLKIILYQHEQPSTECGGFLRMKEKSVLYGGAMLLAILVVYLLYFHKISPYASLYRKLLSL